MSRRNSKVDSIIDTKFSSGDSNMTKPQEENNNQVDELSKELEKMGCIVDGVKRPPNICVENCVYEGSDEEKDDENYDEQHESENDNDDDDNYSEEFEEDKSDDESLHMNLNTVVSVDDLSNNKISSVKLSKSNSNVSSVKPPGSVSGRSSGYGSIRVPQTRRINMSFPNDRLREIERHNYILLNKILSARNNRKSSIPSREQQIIKPVPSAAVHRKQQQRKIDHDNMILLKKIQRAKSSSCSFRR